MREKKIVAKVDDEPIYSWQLEDAMQSYSNEVLKKDFNQLSDTEITIAQKEAIEKLIGSELFYLEAVEAGIDADENDINYCISEFMKHFSSSQEFEIYLAERGINLEELKRVMKKSIIKDRFISLLLKKIPPVTKKDAEKYYEKIKDKISLPPRISFYRVYIDNPTGEERKKFKSAFSSIEEKKLEPLFAERIIKDTPQLIKNAKFEEFIEKPVDELHYEIVRKMLSIEEGFFTKIEEYDNLIEIYYLISKIMHVPMTEEEGKKEAGKYLSIVRLKKILDAYIDMLKEKRRIEIYL